MRRDAVKGRAEDGMLPIEAVERVAAAARLAHVAVRRRVIEVIAPRALHEVTAGRRHIAKLCGCSVQDGVRQQRKLLADDGVRGQMAVRDHRADTDATVRALLDHRQGKPGDIYEETRLLDAL